MSTYTVNLGIGDATGMFYHAPEGTALPETPYEELSNDWELVGDVSSDGITFSTARDFDTIKNWANQIKRLLPSDESETVVAPIIETTESTLRVLFGADNVTVTPATSEHGKLITVDTSPTNTPSAEAFLFLMKDGDDMIMIGTTSGFVTALGDVTFAPNEAISWEATISSNQFVVVKDDNQVTSY